jgi:GH15 family glucan-1,4-alpha-glucosidase
VTRSPFPRIGDYAFLSDCQTSCLVAPDGSVEWMCLPRPDSPSVFAALLDRAAGRFRISPRDTRVPVSRRYLPGSLMLETTWQSRTGWLVVRDALTMGPWHNTRTRSDHHRRPPTDYDAEHCLLRTVRCVSGSVDVLAVCEPGFDYGRHLARWDYGDEGYHVVVGRPDGRAAGTLAGAEVELRLTSDLNLGVEGSTAQARTRMRDGDTAYIALTWGDVAAPASWQDAVERMERTADHWREWITQGEFPDHPWRSHLQRSALTLKGLTYAPTGALLAASTTSLPETPGGSRNWDYRYSWVRDSTFALWGLYTLGLDREADDFFAFVSDVCDGRDRLQIMYGVGGERELDESELDHLGGYEGARPVRIGNAAWEQRQHDVWGAVLDSVYLHVKSREQLPETLWPLLFSQVEQAMEHWREPDHGIWEVRGDPQHFTSSKLFAWVAMDRGARLAEMHQEWDLARRWQSGADAVREDLLAQGVDERGVFVQHYGTTALDASALLVPLVRLLPPDDPRVVATVHAVADELTEQGLVLRYRPDETDDGQSGTEGTFAICSFWLVSALVEIGQTQRAEELCERLLSHASPLGLYAEELEPHSGRHLGNFPQAFTHLGLINAVMHVIRAQEGTATHRFAPAHRHGSGSGSAE